MNREEQKFCNKSWRNTTKRLHLHLSTRAQRWHFMAPGDAVNLSTHLQGNHLLLNVTDGIHCFYNLCGWILEEPPSLPSPPKLLCRERFLVKAQQSKHKRQSKKGDPTELSQKYRSCVKKHPGMWNSSASTSPGLQQPRSLGASALFIKGLNSFAFLQKFIWGSIAQAYGEFTGWCSP